MGAEDRSDSTESQLGQTDTLGSVEPDAPLVVGTSPGEAQTVPVAVALAAGERALAAEGVALSNAGSAPAEEQGEEAPERFDSRDARAEDIPAMVEIDLVAFRRVYAGQGRTDDELRRELTAMFETRLGLLGGELMPVVVRQTADGQEEVVGFTHLMRTNKGPDEFVSWEDTTANGWLADRHDTSGQYMYVVTLSMSPSVAREDAPNLLAAHARAVMIEHDCELIYAESRMPGLLGWVERWCQRNGVILDDLGDTAKWRLASEYFGLKRVDPGTGMELPRDPMLAFCVQVGYIPQRLVANAYNDAQSMNFGAVCVIPNSLLPHERTAEHKARLGQLLRQAAHSLDRANVLIFGAEPTN